MPSCRRAGQRWGPKLQGKLHLYVGSDDTYMLNNAVYPMQDFLDKTGTPGYGVPYDGEVKYGPRAEHCWNGDPDHPNWYSRLHYNQMYVPKMLDRIAKTAPAGADLRAGSIDDTRAMRACSACRAAAPACAAGTLVTLRLK